MSAPVPAEAANFITVNFHTITLVSTVRYPFFTHEYTDVGQVKVSVHRCHTHSFGVGEMLSSLIFVEESLTAC